MILMALSSCKATGATEGSIYSLSQLKMSVQAKLEPLARRRQLQQATAPENKERGEKKRVVASANNEYSNAQG